MQTQQSLDGLITPKTLQEIPHVFSRSVYRLFFHFHAHTIQILKL